MLDHNTCHTLLTFICFRMELHGKTQPIGKVQKNLPLFKEFEDAHNFTQDT